MGSIIDYPIGATITVDAEVSDQQCGPGLHVFLHGLRPEWFGYCPANHDLMPIDVEVHREDICFAGYPGAINKIRVKKLKVLT